MLGRSSGSSARSPVYPGHQAPLPVTGNVLGQELDGDKAMQPSVLSFVNNTHPAATEFLDNAVVRDGSADHWRESYVCETGQVNESRGVGGSSERLLVINPSSRAIK